ncbi:MAG: ATPase [Altererythrobacter sp.]|nr:ATPase [Altererythrobacter sp.]
MESAEGLAEEPIVPEDEWLAEEDEIETAPRTRWIDRLVPTTAIIAMLAWTGFFAWTFRSDILTGGMSQQWIDWIISWAVPMLLISIFWLLSMRNSQREAQRFGDTAQMLRQESQALEERLGAVNRELSLAREFLGSQSRELDSLGRIASERISTHASELQTLIKSNGAQVDAIASVSDTALINMSKLRDDLPVIANSARDVSNQVGQAGRTAHEQLEHLVSGFERLNEFGKASERQVSALSGKIETTLAGFTTQLDSVENAAEARFASLNEQSDTFRVELEGREVDALAAMRKRSDDLRQSVISMAEELADQETAQIGHLQMRLDTLREGSEEVTSHFAQSQDDALDKLRARKSEFQEEISEVVARLDQLDQQAINASRERVKALHAEATDFDDRIAARNARFEEEIARRQHGFETREAQASEVLAQRLTQLDDMLAERSEAQSQRLERLVAYGTDVSGKLEELNTLLASMAEQAEATQAVLDAGTAGLGDNVSSLRSDLNASGQTIGELTESGVRLLEILQSGAREARDTLPAAVDRASAKLGSIEQQAASLRQSVDAAHERSAGLSDYVIAASESLSHADEQVTALSDRLADTSSESLTRISNLRVALGALGEESDRVTSRANEDLQAAIAKLEKAAQSAFAAIESGSGERLEALAEEIGVKASAAIERSLRAEGDAAVERLEEASVRANDTARATTANLRDQLVKVNELAGNLEERVSRARDEAHEQVDNDFARRMALITESLNSNAIDIAKGLSQDVSDTAWAAYLKGDRGIFARKSVRLVNNVEAREVMELFEADHDFREHVSRYIHDFESMLRNVLSTRDGNALGVTLLSSDIGKLYVALAQSIERLRD